jgi:hypothetical protein
MRCESTHQTQWPEEVHVHGGAELFLGLALQDRQLAGAPRIGHHDVDVREIVRQAPDSLIVGDIQLDGDNSVAVVLDGVREGISTPGGSVNALGTTC